MFTLLPVFYKTLHLLVSLSLISSSIAPAFLIPNQSIQNTPVASASDIDNSSIPLPFTGMEREEAMPSLTEGPVTWTSTVVADEATTLPDMVATAATRPTESMPSVAEEKADPEAQPRPVPLQSPDHPAQSGNPTAPMQPVTAVVGQPATQLQSMQFQSSPPAGLSLSSQLTARQTPGSSLTQTVTLSNSGDNIVTWSLAPIITGTGTTISTTNTMAGSLWQQPAASASGRLSLFSNNDSTGLYQAAAFRLATYTEIDEILVEGFSVGSGLAEATTFSWYIYADADGQPAGQPEDGLDTAVWQHTASLTGTAGLTVTNDNLTLHLANAGLASVGLENGRYWLLAFAHIDNYDENNLWAWQDAATPGGLQIAPGNLNNQPAGWQTTPHSRAFALTGRVDCAGQTDGDWLTSSATGGQIAPQSQTDLTITFDATTLAEGSYEGHLCFSSDSDNAPFSFVSLTHHVYNGPVIELTPATLTATLAVGQTTTRSLTIHNSGNADLTYQLNPLHDRGHRFLRVAILGADYEAANVTDLTNHLAATNRFEQIDFINIAAATPTLAELLPYDALLVYSWYTPQNRVDLGNIVADYVDAGGGVLVMYYAFMQWGRLEGRFLSDGYYALDTANDGWYWDESPADIGIISDLDHPVLRGVDRFRPSYEIGTTPVLSGSQAIAHYTNGYPMLVEQAAPMTQAPRLDLNSFPISNNVDYWYWYADTDGAQLMANALDYVALADYISSSSQIGTIAAGSNADLTLTIDSTGLISDTYTALLRISSNDPVQPQATLPITLTVTGVPSLTLPTQAVTMSDTYVGHSSNHTLVITNSGTADLTIDSITSSHPDISATHSGNLIFPYQSQPITITFAPQISGTVNATLDLVTNGGSGQITVTGEGLLPPIMTTAPAVITAAMTVDALLSRTFTISNEGQSDLLFNITAVNNSDTISEHNYFWQDSNQPDGPAYNWQDISGSGTPVTGLFDDGYVGPFPIGFDFSFFGGSHNEFYITDNGYIGFGPPDNYGSRHNRAIPSTNTPSNFIAWFWDDLVPRPDTAVYYQQTSAGLVIQIGQYGRYGGSYSNARITVQLLLTPRHEIYIHYADIVDNWPLANGTIGIENADGTDGLQVAHLEAYIEPGLTLYFADTPAWLDLSAAGGVVSPSTTQPITLTIDSSGLISGTYAANLLTTSNDPANGFVATPLTVTVTGTPVLTTTTTAVDFGLVYVGITATSDIALSNIGTADLSITAVDSGHPDLTIPLTSTLLLPVGQSHTLPLYYHPSSDTSLTATVTITSSGGVLTIPVSGAGLLPPQIEVVPSAIVDSLNSGELVTHQMIISNTGSSDLLFDINKQAGIGYLDIAVLGAESTISYADDVVNKLTATGQFNSVTFINVSAATPALETLQAYDAVLVFRRNSFQNRTQMGNVLADYVDSGGGVVLMHFALYNSGYLLGRFHADGYHVIDPVNSSYQSQTGGHLSLDTIHLSNHPILHNVTTFDSGYYSYHSSGDLMDGSTIIAEYSNNRPLIVEKTVTTPVGDVQRLDLNFVPISSDVAFGYWNAASDGATLMANALRYVAQPDFLDMTPATGLVTPGSSQAISVTLAATDLVSGTYQALLEISHNDPFVGPVTLPITLSVSGTGVLTTAPNSLDFGSVYVGVTVSETLMLGNTGTADLVVTGIGSDHPDINSNFSDPLPVPIGSSQPLFISYLPTNQDLLTATITITSSGGVLTVPVSGAGLLPPIIEVAPDHFDETLPAGSVVTRSLTITNAGSDDLTFALHTTFGHVGLPGSTTPRVLLLVSGGNPETARTYLVATGLFETADFDILNNPSNLTLAMLQPYDVILVWNSSTFSNAQNMGNALKEFVDDGGGVVLATYSLTTNWGIQGGILDAGYSPFLPGSTQSVSGQLNMDSLADANHPIFTDITAAPVYWSNNNYSNPALNSGGLLLAQDTAGNRVVAQNETGKVVGIVIYPGNLNSSNSETSRLFANALYFAHQPFTWLGADPTEGTIPGGSSEAVTMTLDATDLISGTYQTNLFVNSNDPFTSLVTVPVTMTVVGSPLLEAAPDPLEFGTVYVGVTAVHPITVSNSGTAAMTLLSAGSSHPDVTILLTDTIPLTPGAQQPLTVTYAPTAQAPVTATITFTGTDNTTATLVVTGQGLLPPTVAVDPTSFEETIAAGTSLSRSLTINNSGDSPLTYTLATTYQGGVAGLTVTDDFDPGIDFSQWSDIVGGTASTNCGSVSGNALYFSGAQRRAETIDLNTTYGGQIAFYLKIGTGSFPCEQADSGEEVYLQYSNNSGATWTTIDVYGVAAYPNFTPIVREIPAEAQSAATRFRWIQFSHSGTSYDHWAIDNVHVQSLGLVFASPDNGVIEAGNSLETVLTLDATELISSTYLANVNIYNNDPFNAWVTVPITLHVTGIPAIDLITPALDMGTAFVGYPTTRTLTVANTGTDVLHISAITSDNSHLSASGQPLTIPAREQRNFTVTYLPAAPGTLDANLIVYSSDPDSPAQVVPVAGDAIHPPALTYSPTSFSFSVNTDQIVTQTLNLGNDGLSDLTFDLSTASDRVQLTPITGTIPAGGQQVISVTVNGVQFNQGSYNDQVIITSNDPEAATVSLPVSIEVVLVAPGQPTNPSPQDEELNVRIDKTLTWQAPPHATSYDLTLWPEGESRPGTPTVTGLTGTSYNPPGNFPTDARYYWDVLARNNAGTTQGAQWSFVTETLPDLEVTGITVPPTAFSGQPFEISWIVTNNGDRGTTVATWYDRVYVSTSPTFDSATAVYLGQRSNPAYLGPGESYARQAEFTLPQGISGNYYAFVVTDATNRMRESDEANNTGTSSSTINVQLTPPPDLQVTAVTVPNNAFAGATIAVNWLVTNEGSGGTIRATWYDRLYLSSEPTLNTANATVLATVYHNGALAAGQAYTGTRNVTLPHTIFGDYYLFVVTDIYNNVYEYIYDDNNTSDAAGPIDISLSAVPDLEVTSLETPPAAESSSTINVEWTVTNWGTGPTFETTWRDRVYLSTSPTFTTTEAVILATVTRNGSLDMGASYSVSRDLTLPDGISGTYYIYVWTDFANQVFEYIFEDNNITRSDSVAVTLAQSPDLIVPEVETSATAVVGGNPIVVNWTVANQGEATPTTSWQDRVYLSPLPTWNGTGSLLGTFTRPANLAPGQFYTQTRTVVVPSHLASNNYYLYIWTDATNTVYEHEAEDNNVSRAANPIAVTAPSQAAPTDLVIGTVSGPVSGSSGGSIAVSWTVTNTAGHATVATSWRDGVYLSADTTLNPGSDILLVNPLRSGALAAGSSYQRNLTINLPNGIEGEYYLFFRNDIDNQVNDNNRSNNTTYLITPISITLSLSPDLVPTVVNPAANATAGQPLELVWSVANQGQATANGPWYDAVYLSDNATLETGDQRLVRRTISGNLAPGAAYTQTTSVNIPQGISGIYYLLLQTDSRNDVYEHGAEDNNVVGWPITVTIPPPADLTVLTVTVPSTAVPGDPITIDWTIQNIGDSPANGTMCDAVFISGDTTWNVNDAHVGNHCRTINLAPGDMAAFELQTTMPSRETLANLHSNLTGDMPGVTPGEYYAIVRTDILNNINESDLSNNTGVSTDTMMVDVTPLTLGVPVSGTLGTSDGRFYRVDVPAGETLLVTLASNNGLAANELYVRYGQVPSRSNFDYAFTTPLQANQEVIVPATQEGTYYIFLYGANVPGGSQQATITAELLEFEVRAIDSNRGGNVGEITVRVQGAKFDDLTTITLDSPALSTTIPAYKIEYIHPSLLFATFDLLGAPAGSYDLIAETVAEDPAILIDGFTVLEGGGPQLVTSINHPANTRPGNRMAMTIYFANAGTTDLPTPMKLLLSQGGAPIAQSPAGLTNGSTSLHLMLQEKNGPQDVLRPGATGSIVVYTQATNALSFSLYDLEPGSDIPIPWDDMKADFALPGYLDDAYFESYWDYLRMAMGETNGELRANILARQHALRQLGYDASVADIYAIIQLEAAYAGEDPDWADELPLFGPQAYTLHNDPVDVNFNTWGDGGIDNSRPYDPNQPTRVIIHGFRNTGGNADNNYTPQPWMSDMANALRQREPNSNIIVVDWADGAQRALWNYSQSARDTLDVGGQVATHLREIGANPDNTHLIGHSLGAQTAGYAGMLYEARTGNQIDRITGLDPAGPNFEGRDPIVRLDPTDARFVDIIHTSDTLGDFNRIGHVDFFPNQGDWFQPGCWNFTCNHSYAIELFIDSINGQFFMTDDGTIMGYDVQRSARGEHNLNTRGEPYTNPDGKRFPIIDIIIIPPQFPGDSWTIIIIFSYDPNDILGPEGYGDAKWIPADTTLDYMIRFENDEELATAAAQRVTIDQTLDEHLDIRTFRLGSFGFGDHIFEVPENRSFYQSRMDLVDELGLFVDFFAGINIVTGEAFWIFQSIDPQTGAPPTDALAGFLPPNVEEGEGEGFVTYNIRPRLTVETGDVVDAEARIIFDDNDPIDTPPIFNTLDAGKPTSAVDPLPERILGNEVVLTWSGSDDEGGSGLHSADLYVSVDDSPFVLVEPDLTESTYVFNGLMGHTYGFYTLARDNAGNREAAKTTADTVTFLFEAGEPAIILLEANPEAITADGVSSSVITATVTDGDDILLPGEVVTFTTSLGSLNVLTATTDVMGVVTATLTAGMTPGTAVVAAQSGEANSDMAIPLLDRPIADLIATNNSPTTVGQTTALTATIAEGSNVSYLWAFGDGVMGTVSP
jgi:hypothetical protein